MSNSFSQLEQLVRQVGDPIVPGDHTGVSHAYFCESSSLEWCSPEMNNYRNGQSIGSLARITHDLPNSTLETEVAILGESAPPMAILYDSDSRQAGTIQVVMNTESANTTFENLCLWYQLLSKGGVRLLRADVELSAVTEAQKKESFGVLSELHLVELIRELKLGSKQYVSANIDKIDTVQERALVGFVLKQFANHPRANS